MARKEKYWIQKAIEKPRALRNYMKRRYGDKAFDEKGRIKVEYLHKVLRDPDVDETTKRRVRLALTLRRLSKRR